MYHSQCTYKQQRAREWPREEAESGSEPLVFVAILHLSSHRELQESLIRSHSAGVGSPLSPEQTRRVIALRINVLAKAFRYGGCGLVSLIPRCPGATASTLYFTPGFGL